MNAGLVGVLLPHAEIRLHGNPLHAVQRGHVKLTHGFIVLRRIACGHDDPAAGDFVAAKGLCLQKLQHRGRQRLRRAVDLIDEQNPLGKPGLLDLLVDRGHDLAHGVLRHRVHFPAELLLGDERQADGALTGVVGDGVGHETHAALPGHLLHDLRLSDSGRPHQKKGPLPHRRDQIFAPRVLRQVRLDGIFYLLFRSLDVHFISSTGPRSSGSNIILIAHAGTSTSR